MKKQITIFREENEDDSAYVTFFCLRKMHYAKWKKQICWNVKSTILSPYLTQDLRLYRELQKNQIDKDHRLVNASNFRISRTPNLA